MEAIYPKKVMEALATVTYAGTKKNLVESEMVADTPSVGFDRERGVWSTKVVLLFERDTDPFLRSTVKAAEAAIKYYCGKDVEVEIETEFKKAARPSVDKLLPEVENIIAVSSGKGGVGKSTVSANLAIALARLGYRVGLLDCDIFGPSMTKMFGVEDARPYAINKDGRDLIVPVEKYGVKLLSIGFFVDPQTATLWRGGMATGALKQLIGDADWGALDYLILDTPPGTSDIHLTLLQTERAHSGIGGEHGVVHACRAAREPLLSLWPRGLQAAGRGDAGAVARSDSHRAEHLRRWRPGNTHCPPIRQFVGSGLPRAGAECGHGGASPQCHVAEDEDRGNEIIDNL